MDLKSDKRQHIQLELNFSIPRSGEACGTGREETESPLAVHDTESPAITNRWMEEVCERENLKEAWRQVKANKGSAGIDRMTVGELDDYLKQHWSVIHEQLLNGTYEPKPVGGWKSLNRRVLALAQGCESLASRQCWIVWSSRR